MILKGGTFCPPITDATLAKHETTANAQPDGPIKDAMQTLLVCVKAWWALPDVQLNKGSPTPLTKADKDSLDSVIPWTHELESMTKLFKSAKGEVADAAYGLLFVVKELDKGREPATTDSI